MTDRNMTDRNMTDKNMTNRNMTDSNDSTNLLTRPLNRIDYDKYWK